MSIPIFVVDAFREGSFKGNPAGVCLLSKPREEAWMQGVAAEMKHSETAFLSPRDSGFDLRWFTPAVEVQLCGHATLASAHVLWQEGQARADQGIRFFTHSGELRARRDGDLIWLDFPARPPTEAAPPPHLLEALGVTASYVGRSVDDYLVAVESASDVRKLKPDIAQLHSLHVRGVIVTAPADDKRVDFVSRFFAPGAGVDEDPVTGSAHCTLAVYWQERLRKSEFMAHQLSARGGVVRLKITGERVFLGGHAVTFLKGMLGEG